jgi:hypothetical protein
VDRYYQWSTYRLELLEERFRDKVRKLRTRKQTDRKFDVDEVKNFMWEQAAFLEKTAMEIMREEDQVNYRAK